MYSIPLQEAAMHNQILCPERLRRIPSQFNWVDHRLVRDRHIDGLHHQTAALYLFLVTVSDQNGLSYYSDFTLTRRLSMSQSMLDACWDELVRAGLVCLSKPLCQVLSLAEPPVCDVPTVMEFLP
jgi:hypothetical protein